MYNKGESKIVEILEFSYCRHFQLEPETLTKPKNVSNDLIKRTTPERKAYLSRISIIEIDTLFNDNWRGG